MPWEAETALRHVTLEARISKYSSKFFFSPALSLPGDRGGVLFIFILFTLLCGLNSAETWVSAEETMVSETETILGGRFWSELGRR